MRNFIQNKMDEIYKDFKKSLAKLDTCCILKDVSYLGGNIPDYSIPIIQQLYLLRYFPAYLIEYYDIYRTILRLDFIENIFNILSIGTGCGIDYCGLEFALRDYQQNAATHAYYTGLDKVGWKYRENFNNKDCYFVNKDITEWGKLDEEGYNIIIFPKSIGEFDGQGFNKVIDIFKKTNFTDNKLCLVSSLRKQSDRIDGERLERLINTLVK